MQAALVRLFILFPPIAAAEFSMARVGVIVLDVLEERLPAAAAFLRCC